MPRIREILLGAVVLTIVGAACSQGMAIEGPPGTMTITRVSFLFDNAPEAEFNTGLANQADLETVQQQETTRVEPSAKSTSTLSDVDTTLIAGNPVAAEIAVPATTVDPGLQVVGESRDPVEFVSPELIRHAGLESYFVSGSERGVTSPTAANSPRPVRVFQEVFVHSDSTQAQTFYEVLKSQSAPRRADAMVEDFRSVYPNLEPTYRATEQFSYASQTQLIEVRIDPRVEGEDRTLGPGDPHIYYLALREGRVTALVEITYLAQQDPAAVALIFERLVQRIPLEFREVEAQ